MDTAVLNDVIHDLQESVREISKVIVGQEQVIRHALAACICGGHVLFEDVPGTGKTTLASSIATVLGIEFTRIQGTPDLLPSDVLGSNIFHPVNNEFHFHKGPVFTQLLLMDEINRSTPRTQSALLEAMAERQVTVEGQTYQLDEVFFVIATSNPLESQGVFLLPEAQLDRFLVQLRFGYSSEAEELEMVKRIRLDMPVAVSKKLSKERILQLRRFVSSVTVSEEVLKYIVRLCRATRDNESILLGASPRSIILLTAFSQSLAVMNGRNYVVPDDVKEAWIPVMRHRIRLQMQWDESGKSNICEEVLREILEEIKTPGEHLVEVD